MKHYEITLHEFGKQNSDVIVMFHPLSVWGDVFDRVIPILKTLSTLCGKRAPGL